MAQLSSKHGERLRDAVIVGVSLAIVITGLLAPFTGAVPNAVTSVTGGLVLSATLWFARRNEPVDVQPILTKQVDAGRRLAIHDQETGLLARWYLATRLDEECERAGRYNLPLSIVLIAVREATHEVAIDGRVLTWLRLERRSIDLACALSPGKYVLVLPNTSGENARVPMARLQAISGVQAACVEYPAHGTTREELLNAAEVELTASANQSLHAQAA